MTVTDQIKVLNRNIMENEAQYDLDRKAAEISALFSNDLDKYEYLTGEDVGLKPSTIEQTKFECSPLGKIFNKGLSEDAKKEGLFQTLKSIEDKNEKQLKAIEDNGKKQLDTNSKSLNSISYFSQLSTEAKELFEKIKIKKEKNDIDPEKLVCAKTDGTIFNFSKFKVSLDLTSNIYKNKGLVKDAENKQQEIKILKKLRNYNPTKPKKIKAKEETLIAAEKLLNIKKVNKVIDAFKTGIFPYIDGFQIKEEEQKEEHGFKTIIEYNEDESKGINYDLFKHYFNFVVPSALAKQLYKMKKKKKNDKLVKVIKNGLSDLKNEIEKMSEDVKEIEQLDKILKIVKKILDFNRQQQGKGLQISTPNQMLRRLTTTLAQLNAGNNSEKLKNEIK